MYSALEIPGHLTILDAAVSDACRAILTRSNPPLTGETFEAELRITDCRNQPTKIILLQLQEQADYMLQVDNEVGNIWLYDSLNQQILMFCKSHSYLQFVVPVTPRGDEDHFLLKRLRLGRAPARSFEFFKISKEGDLIICYFNFLAYASAELIRNKIWNPFHDPLGLVESQTIDLDSKPVSVQFLETGFDVLLFNKETQHHVLCYDRGMKTAKKFGANSPSLCQNGKRGILPSFFSNEIFQTFILDDGQVKFRLKGERAKPRDVKMSKDVGRVCDIKFGHGYTFYLLSCIPSEATPTIKISQFTLEERKSFRRKSELQPPKGDCSPFLSITFRIGTKLNPKLLLCNDYLFVLQGGQLFHIQLNGQSQFEKQIPQKATPPEAASPVLNASDANLAAISDCTSAVKKRFSAQSRVSFMIGGYEFSEAYSNKEYFFSRQISRPSLLTGAPLGPGSSTLLRSPASSPVNGTGGSQAQVLPPEYTVPIAQPITHLQALQAELERRKLRHSQAKSKEPSTQYLHETEV